MKNTVKNLKGFVTPLAVVFLIGVMWVMEFYFAQYAWYSTTLNILYLAFVLNAWFDCGRFANMLAAFLMVGYAVYVIPNEPFRLIIFSLITLSIGFGDGLVKERLINYARQLERAIQENNRKTEEIRKHNQLMVEISQLGSETRAIINRIEQARNLISDSLSAVSDTLANEKIKLALYKLNESQTLITGYETLAKNIEKVKASRLKDEE